MKKITTIPSKKILFKNVPITGLFFFKRTLYRKISLRDAACYPEQSGIFFDANRVVRFIAKQHESVAIDIYENKIKSDVDHDFCVSNTVEILKKNVLGKIVSVNRSTCLVQYKNKDAVNFDEFAFDQLKKISK